MVKHTNTDTTVALLAELRLLVAALGEQVSPPWWNTSFFASSSESFLKFNFPRTSISASVASVQEAARKSHDQAVGAVGSYHLFRFPAVTGEQIHHTLLRCGDDWSETVSSLESGLNRLRIIAGDPEDAPATPGAIDCGALHLAQKESIVSIAAAYLVAFENGVKCFPYFQISA